MGLTLEIEKLTLQNNDSKSKVDHEVTKTQSQQIELDKSAEEFRRLHEERRAVVAEWESCITGMKARDEQLEKLGELYANRLGGRRGKEQKLKERINFLEDTQAENAKVQQVILSSDRQLMRVRKDHISVRDGLTEFKDEVDVLRNQLGSRSALQSQQRHKLVGQKEELEEKKTRLAGLKRKLTATEKGLQDEQDASQVKRMSCGDADVLLKAEQQHMIKAEKDLKTVKEQLFRQAAELTNEKEEEKQLQGEIGSAQSALRNLGGEIARLDGERQRQQELLYGVDFQSQLMQRKVARVSGDVPTADTAEYQAKIEELEQQLVEQKQLEVMLTQQVKRQVNELKNAEASSAKVVVDKKELHNAMVETELETR